MTGSEGRQLLPGQRRRLGDVLVESGLLTPEQLREVLDAQVSAEGPRRRLGQVVVELGYVTERDMAKALAEQLGLEMVDLASRPPATDYVRMLPKAVSQRTHMIVIEQNEDYVTVAASDPTHVLALDDVRLYTRASDLHVVVATEAQIQEHIGRAWSIIDDPDAVAAVTTNDGFDDLANADQDIASAATDAPIVRLVASILADAVRLKASDIHVEPQRDALRVRFRIDGVLRDVSQAPRRIAPAVTSRIKVMSGLDIAERRVPQDGRTRLQVEGRFVDARVSTLPGVHGEKVVIRLLAGAAEVAPLESVGLEAEQLDILRNALSAPQGLVLITGPTGSGKTSTLYSALRDISDPGRNVITLEDPVEVQFPGITQVAINPRQGLTFGKGLRSVLRQDPDIVLVGEVRDVETAKLALEASLTGHLVLTTLHTSSAAGALTRLVDMGVEPYLVASSLTAAVAQRLVRTPCQSCAREVAPDPTALALLGLQPRDVAHASFRQGSGCGECGNTGYRGRTGVFEVLAVDSAMRRVLLSTPTEEAVSARARAARSRTLRGAALALAFRGETTLEEVLRVTHDDRGVGLSCPACRHAVQEDMVACPWCRASLDTGHCASCSRQIDAEWRICPWCRTPAISETSAKVPSAGGVQV
ncbi:MAG: ATPase, T2SS/T4P/T4SS family [Actinomycetes bacterium]